MRQRYYFLIGITFFLTVSIQIIETIIGKVVGVTDGDSITLLVNDSISLKIRLDGIDCPEKNQSFGTKAKQFSSDFVFGKSVVIQKTGIDKYGRTLGYVILSDSINLNKELLKAGLAWHYKKYNSDPELARLEHEAKIAKKGLWSDSLPTAPWDFRHGTANRSILQNNNLNDKGQNHEVEISSIKKEGNVWICNSSASFAFHKYECTGLNRCKSTLSEVSVEKAESLGRTPCKICKW